jgi:hypothetical protein
VIFAHAAPFRSPGAAPVVHFRAAWFHAWSRDCRRRCSSNFQARRWRLSIGSRRLCSAIPAPQQPQF